MTPQRPYLVWLASAGSSGVTCGEEGAMKTIMLVDDSATILLSISNILAKAGYGVNGPKYAPKGH